MAKELTKKEIIELCIQCENISLSEKVKIVFKKYEGFPIYDGPVVKKKGKAYDINLRPKDGDEVAIIFIAAKELLLDETANKYFKEYAKRVIKCESLKEKEGFILEEIESMNRTRNIDQYIDLGYSSEKGKRSYTTRPNDFGEERIFSYVTGAAYYKYELFLGMELENMKMIDDEEREIDSKEIDLTLRYKLVLLYELGVINYLMNTFSIQINEPIKIIKILSAIFGIKANSKVYKTFKSEIRYLINNSQGKTPANPSSINSVHATIKSIGIDLNLRKK